MIKMFDNMVDYILAHYLVRKENTDFWKEIKYNLKITDSLKNILSMWKNRLPHQSDVSTQWGMFSSVNYIPILYGLNWFNIKSIRKEYEMFPYHEQVEIDMNRSKNFYNSTVAISHKQIIQMIKETENLK